MEEENKIKVYVKIDNNSNITAVNSGIFFSDLTDWIEIDEGAGDKYAHTQGNYFEKPLIDDNSCHNYKYENNSVRETTNVEKELEKNSFSIPVDEETKMMKLLLDQEIRLSLLELGVK